MNAHEVFDKHMRYIAKGDIAAMINDTFTEDAEFHHNWPFFAGEPPYVVRGRPEIIEATEIIFAPDHQGKIVAGEPFNFVSGEGFLAFQIYVTSPVTGRWLITDCWLLRGDQIAKYVSFGYNIK